MIVFRCRNHRHFWRSGVSIFLILFAAKVDYCARWLLRSICASDTIEQFLKREMRLVEGFPTTRDTQSKCVLRMAKRIRFPCTWFMCNGQMKWHSVPPNNNTIGLNCTVPVAHKVIYINLWRIANTQHHIEIKSKHSTPQQDERMCNCNFRDVNELTFGIGIKSKPKSSKMTN